MKPRKKSLKPKMGVRFSVRKNPLKVDLSCALFPIGVGR